MSLDAVRGRGRLLGTRILLAVLPQGLIFPRAVRGGWSQQKMDQDLRAAEAQLY